MIPIKYMMPIKVMKEIVKYVIGSIISIGHEMAVRFDLLELVTLKQEFAVFKLCLFFNFKLNFYS